jgi:hypothetical protein
LYITYPDEKNLEDKRKIENIFNQLGVFYQKITDLKSIKYEELTCNHYKPILEKIGYEIDVK